MRTAPAPVPVRATWEQVGAGVALSIVVPALTTVLWFALHERPPGVECHEEPSVLRHGWLDGAGPVFGGVGALLVAMTVWASRLRRRAAEPPDDYPGAPTVIAAGLALPYALVCMVERDAFYLYGALLVLLVVFWFVTGPVLAAVVSWLVWRDRERRRETALLTATLLSAYVALPLCAIAIASTGDRPFCFD